MKNTSLVKPALATGFLLYVLLMLTTASYSVNASLIQQVFINEIHYDNSGSDKNEFIEIAGPAGTSLLDWTIYAYNGSNNSVYSSKEISTNIVLENLDNGFGVYALAFSGLQNGPSDGIALVNSEGSLIQFISYEGVLTAVDGPASGQTSINIGVSELPGTPLNYSLQLTGTGINYDDFNWHLSAQSTAGNINQNQQFIYPASKVTTVTEPSSIELLLLGFVLISAALLRTRAPATE